MPLRTTTTTIDDAIAELEDSLDDLADEVAQIHPDDRDPDNEEFRRIRQQAAETERHLGGLEWARDEWGGDAEFVLGGLTTAEFAHVQDRVGDLKQETVTATGSVEGAGTVFYVAQGVHSAPFADADDAFEDICEAVHALPPQLTQWLEGEIEDLTTVGEREGNSFARRVKEKTESYHGTQS